MYIFDSNSINTCFGLLTVLCRVVFSLKCVLDKFLITNQSLICLLEIFKISFEDKSHGTKSTFKFVFACCKKRKIICSR